MPTPISGCHDVWRNQAPIGNLKSTFRVIYRAHFKFLLGRLDFPSRGWRFAPLANVATRYKRFVPARAAAAAPAGPLSGPALM
jgi:hypothetical protein